MIKKEKKKAILIFYILLKIFITCAFSTTWNGIKNLKLYSITLDIILNKCFLEIVLFFFVLF